MIAPSPTGHKRGHSRNVSIDERRVTVPRRRTKGPLDLGDPPFAGTAAASSTATMIASPPPPAPTASPPTLQTKDLTFLLHPTNFHPLPTTSALLPPFLSAPAPTSSNPQTLLQSLHFRAAAIAAATALTASPPPSTNAEILKIWYIRLVSLCLCNLHSLAAQEIKAFQDLSASFYLDPETGRSVLPWELRVLAITLGNDPRRAITGYYELAAECRAVALDGTVSLAERQVWRKRLEELGIRVANALCLLGDFKAAVRHLKGLQNKEHWALPLVYIRAGMLEEARNCTQGDQVLEALVKMGDGDWEGAREIWAQMQGEMPTVNRAVCELYLGKLGEARKILETLVDQGVVFQAQIFNLATAYELCGDTARKLKLQLAEKVAALGREFTNPSFKM
ncbi:hypothetical protein FN846DRAFT_905847 [Sphaerosporella brunnea]|uniref:Uncharacterized protein n=1 Tax=Sphaerosporella brunnea TaxID=1250544 RepID=A0A5J5F147_9PEZI|nr:hypothetical protein FN846DRAFT_905847 [Sphaerosporella brunnea]